MHAKDHDEHAQRTLSGLGASSEDGSPSRHRRGNRSVKIRVLAGGAIAAAALASIGTLALANPSGGVMPAGATPTSVSPSESQPAGKSARFENDVLALVNVERANVGCRPLKLNKKLRAAARAHAGDMAARNYYDHVSPEGEGPGERMRKAGYPIGSWGENIHKGPKDPKTAMRDWMNSPAHRTNILDCSYKDFGAGVNLTANGPWWVQNFGTKS
ncbi:CAP domain-containing protein [Streptomyces anulatus]|uniref:CAP domain-containing protein n=1 Tax=Streptomyces TaxID=1883 RepID=UPI000D1B28F5|nr:CAP domain-containing protein [Streptomyces sp. TSRI0395]